MTESDRAARVADAAKAYLVALQGVRDADHGTLLAAVARTDMALHDLHVVAGFDCPFCEGDSCPGLISRERPTKCTNPGCGHALSMHNSLGNCRSRTTPDRSGECICGSTTSTARPTKNTAPL